MNTKAQNKMSVFYQIRKKAGLSQEDLARLLDVSFTTVNRWENGRQQPKMDFKQWKTLTLLLMGAGIKPQDLPDSAFGDIKNIEPDLHKEQEKVEKKAKAEKNKKTLDNMATSL